MKRPRDWTVVPCAAALVWLLPALPAARAADAWPEFRGPTRDGHAAAARLPLAWSETENVVWKTPVHGRGWSSPLVWKDQVWLTTATPDGRRMYAVCVDRASGRTVHDVKVFDVERPEPIAPINSYASPTGALEEGRFYAHYGTYGTACLDTATGQVLWTRRDLNCDHHEGPGASVMLHGGLLYVPVDGRDVQYLAALDKQTGRTVWKTGRSVDLGRFHHNLRKCFCAPILIEAGGRTQVFSPAAKAAMAYDPLTGEELWKVPYHGWSIAPRPIAGHGLVFLVNDYDRPELWAFRPGGSGTLPEERIEWKMVRGVPQQPSLVLVEDLLYMVNNDGIAQCVEARTGEPVWRERIEGNYSASLVCGAGRIYFFNRNADATVIATGRRFDRLAFNQLDGELMATPAVAGSALFIRTGTHLYRIEQPNDAPASGDP